MAIELIKTDQLVIRSIYKRFNDVLAELGYRPNEDTYGEGEGERWEKDRQAIINSKGFCIDLFSESSQRHKGMKNMPRIVMFLSRVFDGEIGAPVNVIWEQDTEAGKQYVQGLTPGQSANVVIAVHLVSITSEQVYTLNSIWSHVLGIRMMIPFYTKPEKLFFTFQNNYADLDNHVENFNERAYFHTIPDCWLSPNIPIRTIAPLKAITVEVEHKQDNLDTIEVKSPNQ